MQYVGALLRDLEVYLLNDGSMPTHALITSVEAARKNALWKLWQDDKIPSSLSIYETVLNFNITGKRTLIFQDTVDCPSSKVIAYDHPHCMEKAIRTTSAFGFILRDMNQEFSSRFAYNLLLADKKANTLGSPRITDQAHLGAIIGEGSKHFYKYSILGHIYLFIEITLKQIVDQLDNGVIINQSVMIEEELTKPITYKRMSLFSGEISPSKLAAYARLTIQQFRYDYKILSFYSLVEWRSKRGALEIHQRQTPLSHEYRTIIDENNCFCPHIMHSMEQNSTNLAQHLDEILRLRNHDPTELSLDEDDQDEYLTDQELLQLATRHKSPVTISIDGSINREGSATTTVCILSPDIREYDHPLSMAWQD
jgi:hypothetical protein